MAPGKSPQAQPAGPIPTHPRARPSFTFAVPIRSPVHHARSLHHLTPPATVAAPLPLTFVKQEINDEGKLSAKGGTVEINGSITLGAAGTLQIEASGSIHIGRHLLTAAGTRVGSTMSARLVFDGAGVPTPDLSAAAYFVEAEDFSSDRGQHQSESDTMPYFGGAYQGKGGRDRIDYHQTDNRVASDLSGPGKVRMST